MTSGRGYIQIVPSCPATFYSHVHSQDQRVGDAIFFGKVVVGVVEAAAAGRFPVGK